MDRKRRIEKALHFAKFEQREIPSRALRRNYRACDDKVVHYSRQDAKQHKEYHNLNLQPGEPPVRDYRCPCCDFWHVGHVNRWERRRHEAEVGIQKTMVLSGNQIKEALKQYLEASGYFRADDVIIEIMGHAVPLVDVSATLIYRNAEAPNELVQADDWKTSTDAR